MILGNKENLRRAMNNFLMNAYRYAPKGSHVNVSVAESGNYIIFSVYNDGSQISEKDMERLWDSFYQGSESSGQGTGLGLYIVKSIVAQHGGVCGAEKRCGVLVRDSENKRYKIKDIISVRASYILGKGCERWCRNTNVLSLIFMST